MLFSILTLLLSCLYFTIPVLTAAVQHHTPSKRTSTVKFELDLTWGPVAPDGYQRNGILMNGQFPGPVLELNAGDDVEFLVHNHLPFNEAIHFHGIEQYKTPWSDGVPGLSQRSIKPGESFLYKWTATQYGTYWYHSHDRFHISDGLYGPILIHPTSEEPTPFGSISNSSSDIQLMQKAEYNPTLVLISDWSHFTSQEFLKIQKDANIDDFCIDSVLINGKGSEICLPQSEINELTNPLLVPILNGTTLTPKG